VLRKYKILVHSLCYDTTYERRLRSSKFADLSADDAQYKVGMMLQEYLLSNGVPLSHLPLLQRHSPIYLRRLLDFLIQSRSYRGGDVVHPKREITLADRILDANNRFSVLFFDCDTAEDEEGSDSPPHKNPYFYTDPDRLTYRRRCTIQDKRYCISAESNSTRIRLGYPPKGEARVNDLRYTQVKQADTVELLAQSLITRVCKPLLLWRRSSLRKYRRTGSPDDLTITPLRLILAYEQLVDEVRSARVSPYCTLRLQSAFPDTPDVGDLVFQTRDQARELTI
jgi:hypothetical protein